MLIDLQVFIIQRMACRMSRWATKQLQTNAHSAMSPMRRYLRANVKHNRLTIEQPRCAIRIGRWGCLLSVANRSRRLDSNFEPDHSVESVGQHVIIVREDHHACLRGFNETIATSRQPDVIFSLNESIDQRGFVGTDLRKSQFRLAVVET